MMLEVQTGVIRRGCYNTERLDTEGRKIDVEPTEPCHGPSAERTVDPSEQTEEHWTATEVVTQCHAAVSICCG